MDPLSLLNMGIAVIPVLPKSKLPSVRWFKYQKQLPSQFAILRWFRPGHATNVAVVCGWQGLTVLDFDTMTAYAQWLAWAIDQGNMARQMATSTYRVRTSRGMHVYLLVADKPRCGHFAGGDIKGRGGYVLIPPSVHPSGVIYQAVKEDAPILSVTTLGAVLPDAPALPAPQPLLLAHVASSASCWPLTCVEQVKEQYPILSFFPQARATGGQRWYVAKCPFHDDAHESLWIDTQKGLCGCYVGCTSKPLDVIGLYARIQGMTNREAIRRMVQEVPR